jgi:hypothetical protein
MAITTEELIAKYPKIFQQYEGNPGMVNWYGVPDGWLSIIDKLCGSIQSYIDNVSRYIDGKQVKPKQVTCIQMKEKFGGLRFYADNTDEVVEGMISMAEYMCDYTCQECGSEENIGRTGGWITVLCQTCAGDNYNWKPLNAEPDVQF